MMSLKTTFMTFYRTSCHHRTNKSNTLASTTFSHLVNFFLFGIIIILICIVFYVFNNHVKLELFVSNGCRRRNRGAASIQSSEAKPNLFLPKLKMSLLFKALALLYLSLIFIFLSLIFDTNLIQNIPVLSNSHQNICS